MGGSGQAERETKVPLLVAEQAGVRVHRDFVNLFRGRFRHVLDVHASLRGGHDEDRLVLPVNQNGKVVFVSNVAA